MPVYLQTAEELSSLAQFGRVKVFDEPELTESYKILYSPSFVLLKDNMTYEYSQDSYRDKESI